MKNYTLITLIIAIFMGAQVSAQTIYMEADTSKEYWTAPGDINVYNKVFNNTSSPIKVQWKVASFHKDPLWNITGLCDNILCHGADDAMMSGSTVKTTDFIAAKSYISDMHIIFNGDAAAVNTWAYVTLLLTESASGDDTIGTFAAYKGAVGGITVSRLEDNVLVFPNPARDFIEVLFTEAADAATVTVYDITGKPARVYPVSGNTHVRCEFGADMPAGIYQLCIADSKGNIVARKKVTRQ